MDSESEGGWGVPRSLKNLWTPPEDSRYLKSDLELFADPNLG